MRGQTLLYPLFISVMRKHFAPISILNARHFPNSLHSSSRFLWSSRPSKIRGILLKIFQGCFQAFQLMRGSCEKERD